METDYFNTPELPTFEALNGGIVHHIKNLTSLSYLNHSPLLLGVKATSYFILDENEEMVHESESWKDITEYYREESSPYLVGAWLLYGVYVIPPHKMN